MPIIDFHTHAFPDSLAERAISTLEEKSDWKAETDGTTSGLIALMDKNGVDRSVVASIATKPEQAPRILEWSLAIRSERLEPFASVHPDSPTLEADIEAVVNAGIRGVKIHPLYQGFAVDDPRAIPMFEALADSGLIVLAHSGFDIGFGEIDIASPDRFLSVIDRLPNLRLILAHLGGWKTYDIFLKCMAGRDVYIDTSFTVGFCSDAQLHAILTAHGVDRILYASDSPWGGLARQIAYIDTFPISDEEKEKILYRNARDLLAIDLE